MTTAFDPVRGIRDGEDIPRPGRGERLVDTRQTQAAARHSYRWWGEHDHRDCGSESGFVITRRGSSGLAPERSTRLLLRCGQSAGGRVPPVHCIVVAPATAPQLWIPASLPAHRSPEFVNLERLSRQLNRVVGSLGRPEASRLPKNTSARTVARYLIAVLGIRKVRTIAPLGYPQLPSWHSNLIGYGGTR